MECRSWKVATPGKRTVLFACALGWHTFCCAADVLPAHLTGTWGTAESLYAGEVGQTEMHLDSDGYGVMVGSTPRATRLDGKDDGGPGMRALIGFPLRATLDGTTLTASALALDPKDAERARRSVTICRYKEAGPILTCSWPGGESVVMNRRSATVPAEIARTLEQVRSVAQ